MDKFFLVVGNPQVCFLISNMSGHVYLISSVFWILIANGGINFFFALTISCSWVMSFKARFCSKLFTF